jgi:H+/Cl- antiporter ClcA
MDQQTGKYIIIAGVFVIIVGVVIYFFHDLFKWFGRLPGDIRVVRGQFRFYFPIVTMLLVSILLTLIINLIKRF